MGLLFCVSVFTLLDVFRAAACRTNHSPPHSAQLRVPSRLLASLKCRSPRPLSAGLSRPFCCGPEGADRCASRPLLPHVASCSCPRASRLTRPCLLAAKSFDHTESLKLSSLRGHPAPGCSTTVHRAPSRSTRTRASCSTIATRDPRPPIDSPTAAATRPTAAALWRPAAAGRPRTARATLHSVRTLVGRWRPAPPCRLVAACRRVPRCRRDPSRPTR